VTNTGTFTVTGALGGAIATFNNNGGTLALGANSFTGILILTNAAAVTIGTGSLTAAVIANAGTFTSGGTVNATSSLTNSGTLNAQGTLNTPLVTNTGTFTVTGALGGAITTFANNGGTLAVGANSFTGITTFTNSAALTIAGGGLLTVTNFTNALGGVVTNAGTLTSTNVIANAGTLTTTGALSNGLTSTGTVNAAGTISGAIANNAGTFTVTGALTGDSTFANAAGATLQVNNAFSGITALTNSGAVNVGSTGALSVAPAGGITNTSTGTIAVAAGGMVTDALNNAGIVTNNGAYIADVNTNTGTITNSGTWTGNVLSSTGTITNNLTWTGNISNAGTFTNNAAGTVSNGLTSSGTALNAGTINGGVINAGTFTTTTTGTINGGLTNFATANAAGTISGAIANNAGTFTVTGGLVGDSTFANAAGATLQVNSFFTGLTALTNSGVLSVGSGGALTVAAAGGITNNATGTITVASGGSVTNALTNAGSVTNNGTYNANVTNTGSITNNATGLWNAATGSISNAGSFTSTGTVIAGTFTNSGTLNAQLALETNTLTNTGTFNVTDNLVMRNAGFSGDVTNSGTITLGKAGTTLVAGDISNTGALNFVKAPATSTYQTVSARTLTNNGTINMQNGTVGAHNGSPTDVINLSGAYSGTGSLRVDTAFNSANSDVVRANGGNGGAQTVFIEQAGSAKGIHQDAIVVSKAGATSFTAANPIPTNSIAPFSIAGGQLIDNQGLLQQWFGQSEQGTYVVRSAINSGAATSIIGTVSSLMASVNSVFTEPTSALIGGPADPKPNQVSFAPWVRTRGGDFRVRSATTITLPVAGGISSTVDTVSRIGFVGVQGGLDVGVFNIENTGWALIGGVTGGYVYGHGSTSFTGLTVEQPFVGGYGAITNGSFSVDALVRADFYGLGLSSTDPSLGGQQAFKSGSSQSFSASGWSGLVNGSYRFVFADNYFVEPSVSYLWSHAAVGGIFLNGFGDPLKFNPIESQTGRLGVRVGLFTLPVETIVLSPFLQLSAWHEFAGGVTSLLPTGTADVGAIASSTSRLGTFGQAGLGMAAASTTPGLSGFARGDIRFGDRIDGYALSVGVRNQF